MATACTRQVKFARVLSVIIPTHNRVDATGRALGSVLREIPDDAEVLIIDDGSHAPFALPENDGRIQVLRHETNLGAAAARNTGLRVAKGAWVAFLDSDDRWTEGGFASRLAEARKAMDATPPLTVWTCGFRDVWPGGRARVRLPRSSAKLEDFASGCWFCPGSTAIFRREPIVNAIGLFDEALLRLEDLDWFIRLAQKGGGVIASRVVGAEIARGDAPARNHIEAAGAHLMAKYTSGPLALSPEMLRRLEAYIALERAACEWAWRDYPAAARELLRSVRLVPRLRLHLEDFWRDNAASD